MNDNGFLGKGWSFPPTFSKAKRSVEMLEGEADIESSLKILFSTRLAERSLRSKFGTKIAGMAFEPLASGEGALIRSQLTDAILLHEPRIKPIHLSVEINHLEGRVDIELEYRIVATNNRRNFVYPYYLIEGTEVPK